MARQTAERPLLGRLQRPTGEKPLPVDKKPTQSEQRSHFDYEAHTDHVKEGLHRFGFGEVVEHITPKGLGEKYTSWAQKKLFGTEWEPSQGVPAQIGEVAIDPTVRSEIKRVKFTGLSMNAGYGHLRPAQLFTHFVEIVGGKARHVFLGGDENVLPIVQVGPVAIDPNKFLRAIARGWAEKSMKDAFEQGMIDHIPEIQSEGPFYDALAKGVILLRDPGSLAKDMLHGPRRAIKKTIAEGYAVKDIDTPKTLDQQAQRLYALFGSMFGGLLDQQKPENPGDHHLVLSTHPLLARIVGELQHDASNGKPITFLGSHFGPDVNQPLIAWVEKTLVNFVERHETAYKWAHRLGLGEGQEAKNGQAPNTKVLEGYIAPPAVFQREQLAQKRAEAIKAGVPLTVVALASGVAPAQLGSFTSFLEKAREQMTARKMRIVVQCGAEEGGGLAVHDQLQRIVATHGLSEHVVLHVAESPKAAVDFFEAAAWAPVPMALMVKGAETARMAQALGVPVIPTGIVGDHEFGNWAATLSDSPHMLAFPPEVGPRLQSACQQVMNGDPLTVHYAQKHANPIETFTQRIAGRTADNMATLVEMLTTTITSLPGNLPQSDPAAMMTMLRTMIEEDIRFRKEHLTRRRTTPDTDRLPDALVAIMDTAAATFW